MPPTDRGYVVFTPTATEQVVTICADVVDGQAKLPFAWYVGPQYVDVSPEIAMVGDERGGYTREVVEVIGDREGGVHIGKPTSL